MTEHVHNWVERRRTFQPSRVDEVKGDMTEHTLKLLVYGLTTIELRCGVCGDVKFVSTPGRAMPDEMPIMPSRP